MKIRIIESQYIDNLKKAFEEVMGFPVEIKLVLDEKSVIDVDPEPKKEDENRYPVPEDKQEQFTLKLSLKARQTNLHTERL